MLRALVALPLLVASAANAQVTQPNGLVVPLDSMNGEVQLSSLFAMRGEAIDFIADGVPEPSTFSPLCDFTATFVLNEAGSRFGLAWYNADPADATPPTGGELNEIMPAGTPVGTRITSADIRSSASYAGGLIGFALVGGQTHYSETRYNPVCTSCSPPAPWILAVVYRSTTLENAYYLAFEDGDVSDSSFSNDGDYNDDVFLLEGLVCAGGGLECDTGMPGICAAGLSECNGGAIECRASSAPRAEACNGLDDDCNGAIDDGELCGADEVCDRGVCVGRCMGEFGCAPGLACTKAGLCVEAACIDVPCPTGDVCIGGACMGPCTDVICPGEQLCRAGRCVDPCGGVTCEVGRVCDRGICRERCDCEGCAAGLECDSTTGMCETAECVGVSCIGDAVCRGGACVDACVGAVCPRGQLCSAGQCIPDPDFGRDAGAGGLDSGGGDSDSGALDGMDAGSEVDGGRRRGPPSSSGCGCRTGGRSSPAFAAIGAMLLVAGRWRRHLRSRCRGSRALRSQFGTGAPRSLRG